VVVATLALSPSRADPTDVALVLAFSVLALQAVRNLAMSAIVLGVVCARSMPGALATAAPPKASTKNQVGSGTSVFMGMMGLVLAVGGLGIVLVHSFPRSDDFRDIVDRTYPVSAIDALRVPGVRVFVFDAWSGMVIDRAWPDAHVFVDLRTDMYGLAISQQYQRIIAAFPDATRDLDRSCTTHVLIRPRDALTPLLTNNQNWKVIRSETKSILFQRKGVASGCEQYPIPQLAVG
jgi:hypothetical protein